MQVEDMERGVAKKMPTQAFDWIQILHPTCFKKETLKQLEQRHLHLGLTEKDICTKKTRSTFKHYHNEVTFDSTSWKPCGGFPISSVLLQILLQ